MKHWKQRLAQVDFLLLGLCLAVSGLGLALIYSATRYQQSLHTLPLKQLSSLALGVALFFLFSLLDVDRLLARRRWVFLFNLACLLSLLSPFGTAGDTGNRSWLILPGIPFHLQPAELIKPFFFLLFAAQLGQLPHRKGHPLALALGHLALICGLIFLISGDAGMVVEFGLVAVLLCWAAGVKKRWFLLGGAGAAGAACAVWAHLPGDNYWKMRILVLLDHSLDSQGYGYHQTRSLLTLAGGGLRGMGYLQGTQTQSASAAALPARYTDFIFSVCGEELGFWGCALVLLLLLAVALRCAQTALAAKNPALRLAALSSAFTVLVQTILNVGMCLFVAPVIGLTLPFVSYGGSSLLSLFIAMGMTSSIRRSQQRGLLFPPE